MFLFNLALFTSPCAVGYYAPPDSLCLQCPEKTYKDSPGYGICSPCLNKPPNSRYNIETGLTRMDCPYKCEIIHGEINDSSCHDLITIYYNLFDGIAIPIILIICVTLIVVGRILKSFLKKKPSVKDFDYDNLENSISSPEKIKL